MFRDATFSPCGRYRVRLERVWRAERPLWLWIMLNPSLAGAARDDPTVRRCIGFTERAGGGGFIVENLYSLIATHPATLWRHEEPVGPDCDASIATSLTECDGPVVVAPGAHPRSRDRFWTIVDMVRRAGREPLCLGLCNAGMPRHPLRLPYALELMPLKEMMDRYHERPVEASGAGLGRV